MWLIPSPFSLGKIFSPLSLSSCIFKSYHYCHRYDVKDRNYVKSGKQKIRNRYFHMIIMWTKMKKSKRGDWSQRYIQVSPINKLIIIISSGSIRLNVLQITVQHSLPSRRTRYVTLIGWVWWRHKHTAPKVFATIIIAPALKAVIETNTFDVWFHFSGQRDRWEVLAVFGALSLINALLTAMWWPSHWLLWSSVAWYVCKCIWSSSSRVRENISMTWHNVSQL